MYSKLHETYSSVTNFSIFELQTYIHLNVSPFPRYYIFTLKIKNRSFVIYTFYESNVQQHITNTNYLLIFIFLWFLSLNLWRFGILRNLFHIHQQEGTSSWWPLKVEPREIGEDLSTKLIGFFFIILLNTRMEWMQKVCY